MAEGNTNITNKKGIEAGTAIVVVAAIIFFGGGVAALAITADQTDTSNDVDEIEELVTSVPEDSEFVTSLDLNGFAESTLVEVVGEEFVGSGANSTFEEMRTTAFEDINDGLDEEVPLDIERTDLGKVVVFGEMPEGEIGNVGTNAGMNVGNTQVDQQKAFNEFNNGSFGAILSLDADFEEVRQVAEESENVSVEERDYGGNIILELRNEGANTEDISEDVEVEAGNQPLYFTTLNNNVGIHAVGTEEGVQDAIDASQNENSGIRTDEFGEGTLLYVDSETPEPVPVDQFNTSIDETLITVSEDDTETVFQVRAGVTDDDFSIGDTQAIAENEAIYNFVNIRQVNDEIVVELPVARPELETYVDLAEDQLSEQLPPISVGEVETDFDTGVVTDSVGGSETAVNETGD